MYSTMTYLFPGPLCSNSHCIQHSLEGGFGLLRETKLRRATCCTVTTAQN